MPHGNDATYHLSTPGGFYTPEALTSSPELLSYHLLLIAHFNTLRGIILQLANRNKLHGSLLLALNIAYSL